jgi:hypothetical protein
MLGIAELSKSTFFLFFPLWPLMWVLYRSGEQNRSIREWLREMPMLILIMAIGLYVLNLGYLFEGTLQPLNSYDFVSELFTGNKKTNAIEPNQGLGSTSDFLMEEPRQNRFAGSWLGNIRIPFPRQYVTGLDIQQRDFEYEYPRSYLRGEWRSHGWWYYYLYAIAIKMPIGTIGLCTLAIARRIDPRTPVASLRDELFLVAPAVAIFIVISLKSELSAHMRYALPCLPFAFVFCSAWFIRSRERDSRLVFPCFLVIWSIASSLWIYPHSLSYFNESIGGPLNGPAHLLESNCDWDQDLSYVAKAQRTKFRDDLISFAYYSSPKSAAADLLDAQLIREIARGKPNRRGKPSALFAVRVNLLHGSSWPTNNGKPPIAFRQPLPETHVILRERAGYSVVIFEVVRDK